MTGWAEAADEELAFLGLFRWWARARDEAARVETASHRSEVGGWRAVRGLRERVIVELGLEEEEEEEAERRKKRKMAKGTRRGAIELPSFGVGTSEGTVIRMQRLRG